MKKGSMITIGIGKETRSLIVSDNYLIDDLMDVLPIGTSITATSIEIIDYGQDIKELFKKEEA